MSNGQDDPRWGIPGGAQVFGTAFAAIGALIVATSIGNALAVVLVCAAAGAVCATLVVSRRRRPWARATRLTLAGLAGLTVALIVGAAVAATIGRAKTTGQTPAGGAAGGDPTPALSASGYRLEPSSSILTNDRDKVDLDTNCPGHGPTDIQLGPARCGEDADLILDDSELVSWERLPRLAVPPQGGSATHVNCRELLSSRATIGSIDLRDLKSGSEFCVETDKGAIVAVHVDSVSTSAIVEISFDVWPS